MSNRHSVTEKQLQKELETAQRRQQQRLQIGLGTDGWNIHEPLGRILRYMKDPAAHYHLEKAVSDYVSHFKPKQQSWELIKAGNYYRLMGDHKDANRFFEKAYSAAKREVGTLDSQGSIDYDRMQFLIEVCFLLRKDDEAVAYGQLFHEDDPDHKLLAYTISRLASARLNRDAALAEEIVDQFVNGMKKSRTKIQETGTVTGWDWYELAVETVEEIERAGPIQANRATDGSTLPQGPYIPAKVRENIKRKARLTVEPKQLQEELDYANRCLAQGFQVEGHELLGDTLRRMGDPAANEHLAKAASLLQEAALQERESAVGFVQLGYIYYRMADEVQANHFFEKAYAQARKEVGNEGTGEVNLDDPDALGYETMPFLIIACFMLGRYTETAQYSRFFHENSVDGKLVGYQFAQLAEAKLTNDPAKAEEVIQINLYTLQEDEGWPEDVEGSYDLGAIMSARDLYELALETLAEIEGNS